MPHILIIATLLFLIGMTLIITGMLGVIPIRAMQLGSLLAFIAVILRVIGRVRSKDGKV